MKDELKVFLDDVDVAKLFFNDECGETHNFKERWLEWGDEYHTLKAMIKAGFTWENVESVGGEGEGDTYYNVFKFSKDYETCYVRFDGSYSSYSGTDYDDYYFVTPQEKTITVYE